MNLVNGLSLTEVRYWFYHQTPKRQKEITSTFENFDEQELQGNAVFEQMRDVFHEEIKTWYE